MSLNNSKEEGEDKKNEGEVEMQHLNESMHVKLNESMIDPDLDL